MNGMSNLSNSRPSLDYVSVYVLVTTLWHDLFSYESMSGMSNLSNNRPSLNHVPVY